MPKDPTGFDLREFTLRERGVLNDLLATLGVNPVRVGGVSLYRIPPERFAQYKTIDPRELEIHFARDRLNALLNAAQLYVASNHELSQLSPLRAQESGLLPVDWVTTRNAKEHLANGLLLMATGPDNIALGTLAPEPVLQDLVHEYKKHADKITLIPPSSIGRDPLQSCDWLVVLEYKDSQLAEAVAEVSKRSSGS